MLKTAGFDLNLAAASCAFLFGPWWNPAVEAQAIDHMHRIGQPRPATARLAVWFNYGNS